VHDVFVTLLGGGTLVVVPVEQRMLPARFIREKEISHWFSVPSAADSLHRVDALRPGAFPHLRQTLFCGEPLRWPVAEAWQAAAPNSRVVNLYGPTEATSAISDYVPRATRSSSDHRDGHVPSGRVVDGRPGRGRCRPDGGEPSGSCGAWLSGSPVVSGSADARDVRAAFGSGADSTTCCRTAAVV